MMAVMKPKVGKKPAARTKKISWPPAGGLVRGANAWSSSRMRRNNAGSPMFTIRTAIMRPRRRRNSMNLVAIIPMVGIGELRRSRECLAGAACTGRPGVDAPAAGTVVILGPPACL